MDDATREALKKSIQHWLYNLAVAFPGDAKITVWECPLCKLFYSYGGDCVGCPVREKTGLRVCAGTPWKAVALAKDEWFLSETGEIAYREAALKMLGFLISLYPTSSKETGNAS